MDSKGRITAAANGAAAAPTLADYAAIGGIFYYRGSCPLPSAVHTTVAGWGFDDNHIICQPYPAGANIAALTGNSATSAVGSLSVSVTQASTAPLIGNFATGAVGTIIVAGQRMATVNFTGNYATGAVGSLSVAGSSANDGAVALTGNYATGAVGTLGIGGVWGASVGLTGVQATGALGSLNVTDGSASAYFDTGATGWTVDGGLNDFLPLPVGLTYQWESGWLFKRVTLAAGDINFNVATSVDTYIRLSISSDNPENFNEATFGAVEITKFNGETGDFTYYNELSGQRWVGWRFETGEYSEGPVLLNSFSIPVQP